MDSFKIKYKYGNWKSLQKSIKKYPEESNPFTITSTTAYISIIVNGVLAKGNHWTSIKLRSLATTSMWLWDFCLIVTSQATKINDRKIHKIVFIDDPTTLTFTLENDLVNLSVYLGGNTYHAKVPYKEFMTEISSLADSFILDLNSINPKISENNQFKQIAENRDKIKKMLEITHEK